VNILIEKNVPVRMRDGVILATDVYHPADSDPAPVLLQRLPYNKEAISTSTIFRMVQAGYVVVVQDCRGVYASEGRFSPFYQEPNDGADAIAWAARQPWSNGSVGMFGGSYIGATQWLAATTAPAALRAIAPNVTTADYYESWIYQGGALQLGFILSWILPAFTVPEQQRRLAQGRGAQADIDAHVQAFDTLEQGYRRLPLIDMPHLESIAPYYFDWLAHPSYDEYWKAIAPHEHHEQIVVPALNIGGWHDLFLGGTLANYQGMRRRGGSAAARNGQRLIVGPWAHGNSGAFYAEHAYGLMSGFEASDMAGAQIGWFDHWLKGIDNGVEGEKPVKIFVMGVDKWREEDDWPLPDTQYRNYYLHSGGRANTRRGNGQLSTVTPSDEPEDVYLYDPRNPVPTVGGATFLPGVHITANAGPRDQRTVELREDVLCYTTAALERAVEVTGPVILVVYVAASARDTDFTAKLVDVYPDGRAELLTDGILRARYRNSLSAPELLEPGKRYELRIDLVATSNVFKAGHRIRLDIASSNFPRFDRNSNTGGTIAAETAADFVPSINRVFHDSANPSHLILPIIERG
jgi:uncharacterized protein